MTRFPKLEPSPSALIKFHLTMMGIWASLAIPTVLFWKESILWVSFMSLYANFVGHFSAWDAAKAERNSEEKKMSEEKKQFSFSDMNEALEKIWEPHVREVGAAMAYSPILGGDKELAEWCRTAPYEEVREAVSEALKPKICECCGRAAGDPW